MSVQDLQQAFKKMAETLGNNENQTTVGMNNVYPSPEDRPSGNLDAPWGEPDHAVGSNAVHHGTGVVTEAKQDRQSLLDRVFDGVPQASTVDKAIIAQHFVNGKPGQHEAHSPLLNYKTASKHVPDAPTLAEKVRAVAGRR